MTKTIVFSVILIFYSLLMLCSCTNNEISQTQTITRKGVLYQRGETSPYTGFVIGKDCEGYRGKTRYFKRQYKDGVLCGKSEFWHSNGNLEGIEPYKDGKIHGVASRYYENGKIRSRIHFVNGLRGGSKGEFFWDRNGKLRKG
jgi:hypothetical protein